MRRIEKYGLSRTFTGNLARPRSDSAIRDDAVISDASAGDHLHLRMIMPQLGNCSENDPAGAIIVVGLLTKQPLATAVFLILTHPSYPFHPRRSATYPTCSSESALVFCLLIFLTIGINTITAVKTVSCNVCLYTSSTTALPPRHVTDRRLPVRR